MTVEYVEICCGAFGAHGIEIASVNPANLGTIRFNLIHETGGDAIRTGDPDSALDIHNNFIYGVDSGVRIAVDLTPAARVNIYNNTVYNSWGYGGIVSRDARRRLRRDRRACG